MSKPLAFIIEDDEAHNELFAEALQKVGFATEIYREGGQALANLATATPSLVILDLHLPQTSGKEILEFIRSDPRLAATRVMIVSADTQMTKMLQDKADLTLTKPVSYFQLRTLAARLIAGEE